MLNKNDSIKYDGSDTVYLILRFRVSGLTRVSQMSTIRAIFDEG